MSDPNSKLRWIKFYYLVARNKSNKIKLKHVIDFLEWLHDAWKKSPRDLYLETETSTAPIFIGDIRKRVKTSQNLLSVQGEVGYVRPEIHPKILNLITLKTAPPPDLGKDKEFFDSTHFHIEPIHNYPVIVYEYSRFAPTPRTFAYPYLTMLFRRWNEKEKNGMFGKKPMVELKEIYRTRGLSFLRNADKIKMISIALKRGMSLDNRLTGFMEIIGLSFEPEPEMKALYKIILKPEKKGESLPIEPQDLYDVLISLQEKFRELFDSLEITLVYDNGRSETVNVLADELKVKKWIKLYVDPKTNRVYKTTDNKDAYKVLQDSLLNNRNDIRNYLTNLE